MIDSPPAGTATIAIIVIFVLILIILVLAISLLIYLYKFKKESIPLRLADILDKYLDKNGQTQSDQNGGATIEMEEAGK